MPTHGTWELVVKYTMGYTFLSTTIKVKYLRGLSNEERVNMCFNKPRDKDVKTRC